MIDFLVNEINKDKRNIQEFLKDNYTLKTGAYFKIDIDKPFDKSNFSNYIIMDRTKGSGEEYCNSYVENEREELLDYIKERDILSGILNDDANKALDCPVKSILSTNYLTLFISGKYLKSFGAKGDKFKDLESLLNNMSNKAFDFYKNVSLKTATSLNLKKLKFSSEEMDETFSYMNSENRLNQINMVEEYIVANMENIIEYYNSLGMSQTSKLKLYFYSGSDRIDDSMDIYRKEQENYLLNNLFNKGTAFIESGELKGLISIGFNNNLNKPLVNPKTMNLPSVKAFTFKEALDIKLAYEFLNLICGENHMGTISFNKLNEDEQFDCIMRDFSNHYNLNKSKLEKTMFLKIHYQNKNVENFDLISERSFKGAPINEIMECRDFIREGSVFSFYKNFKKELSTSFSIQQLLAEIGSLREDSLDRYGEFGCYIQGQANNLQNSIEAKNRYLYLKYKNSINRFLMTNNLDELLIEKVICKYTKEAIKNYIDIVSLDDGFHHGIRKILNIKLNLLNRYDKENDLMKLLESVKEKIEDIIVGSEEDFTIENDAEYFYAIGAIALFVEAKSKGNLNYSVFKYYTAKLNNNILKNHIIRRVEIFSHSVNQSDRSFNSIFSAVLSYSPSSNINDNLEAFYLGIASDNIVYKLNKGKRDNTKKAIRA